MKKNLIVLALWLLSACVGKDNKTDSANATVYFNGDIITMASDNAQYVEAIVVKDGKIAFVGNKTDAINKAGKDAIQIDLKGQTLLPGFIDSHGHMIIYGRNMSWAVLRGVKNIPELIARMKEHIKTVPADEWVFGFAYNKNEMTEKRAPSSEELDQISKDRPIIVMDASGHAGSINTTLMKIVGFTAATPDPLGGTILRKPGTKEPLGPVDETALNAVLVKQPAASLEAAKKIVQNSAALWAKNGETTAMESGLGRNKDDIDIVRNAIDKKWLPIDLVINIKETETDDALNAAYGVKRDYHGPDAILKDLKSARPDLNDGYVNRVKLGGVKYWLDGDLNTMWMSQPYTTNPPGVTGVYKGYGQIPDSVVDGGFDRFWKTNFQMNMHVNGDAGAEQALVAIEKAIKKYGKYDHRPVFVHATYLRPDQIKRMKEVGGVPSFLVASIPAAGDIALKFFGKERAENFVATNTMIKEGIKFTLSHDAPVSGPPSILSLVWAAVNRLTVTGNIVGPKECITPYQGLLAVTNYAAYQIKEEKSKGTLENGKLADMVILDKNPLKVDPKTIKDIQVVETIKEGKTVYQKK